MSLFSRKTRVAVFTQAYQLGESDPDALSTNTLLAIYSQTSFSSMIKNMALNGMANKVSRARKYAKNYYTLGLPSGNYTTTQSVTDDTMAGIIATDINYPLGVLIEYASLEPLIPFHFAKDYLLTTRNYDTANNLIDSDYFPDDVVLPEGPLPQRYVNHVLVDNPTTHSGEWTDLIISDDQTSATIVYNIHSYQRAAVYTYYFDTYGRERRKVTYPVTLFSTQEVTEVILLPTSYVMGVDHYIVNYRLKTEELVEGETVEGFDPVIQTWYYNPVSGIYEDLDPVDNNDEVLNYSGMPVIPLRYKNRDLTEERFQDTDLYKTSKKLLNKLGLSITTLADSLNDNDGIGDIDHAYVMFGIDMQTESQACLRYLVYFFDKLADKQIQSRSSSTLAYLKGEDATIKNGYTVLNQYNDNTIATSLTEHGLDMMLSYNWVVSEFRIGNIGTDEEPAANKFCTKEIIRQELTDDYLSVSKLPTRTTYDKSRLIIKMQVSSNVYHYIEVEGLQQSNLIYQTAGVTTTLTNVYDSEDEHNLIIPIDYTVALNLHTLDRNTLFEESMQIVLNSVVVTVDAWYQSGWFRLLSYIIVAVVTYFASPYIGAQLAAAFQSVKAFAQFVLMTIILGQVVKMAFTWLASVIGVEWMMIIAVVVTAVSIYLGYAHPMIHSMATSQQCMQLTMSMVDSAITEIDTEIAEIGQDYEEFLDVSELKLEELKTAQELLEVDSLGADILYSQTHRFTPHIASDSPEMFYSLTLQQNPGVVTLDVIAQWHSVQLLLPEAENFA